MAQIARARAARRRLTDLLEEIADCLPNGVGPTMLAMAAERLRGWADGGEGIEGRFASFLIARLAFDQTLSVAIRDSAGIARAQRARSHLRALEIADALDALSAGESSEPPGSVGYMLRAWFEAERTALEWEAATLLRPGCAALGETGLREFVAPHLSLIGAKSDPGGFGAQI